MKNIILILMASICLFLFSCKQKKYESNAVLLKKAIKAAYTDGDWKLAKSLAYKAREQDPKDANARVLFALALEQRDNLGRAVEEIKYAVSLDPDNFIANYTKGRLLFKAGIYEDCLAPLEKAKSLKPENLQVVFLLARTYAFLKNDDAAIQNYLKLVNSEAYNNNSEIYNELGVLKFKKKNFKAALNYYKKAYEKNDKSPTICFNLGAFWDEMALMSKDKKIASKGAKAAVKYYSDYVDLISVNPESDPQRKKVLKRIEFLKKL